ncbi:MAG: hypothetical protein LAQ30_16840 [Acidobacteriia bacterium]|nr:hypothetical protein [Terriglobia bacterium]
MRPRDTSPEAWKIYLDIQRRMTPAEKIRRVFERSQSARKLKEAALRQKHPTASDREILLRRVRSELGADLFQRVYGHEFRA